MNSDYLLIQRLGWNTKLDLSKLISADFVPQAMKHSIRAFGNGGLFCFAGLFYNKKLGSYRAFATDTNKSVVLKFTNQIVVITPDNTEEFVSKIRKYCNKVKIP